MNDDTKRFLAAIPGRHTFQTFDDKKRPGYEQLANANAPKEQLSRLNGEGAGVYLMINEGDGKGRANAHVSKVRALFADFDGAPLPEDWDGFEPSLITNSSQSKFHALWLVIGFPLDNELFNAYQEALARRFGAKPNDVKGLSRVLRVPGFYHHKGEPYLSRLVLCEPERVYSFEQIEAELPLPPRPEPTPLPAYRAPTGSGDLPSAEKVFEVVLQNADFGKGRNAVGFDLALQLRDNRHDEATAQNILLEYQAMVEDNGDHPYTVQEALDSLRQAYSQPPREPWAKRERSGPQMRVSVSEAHESDPTTLTPAQVKIHLYDHGYALDKGKDGLQQLTNWTFTPALRLVYPDHSEGERGELVVNGARSQTIDLPARAWNSRKEILDLIGAFGAVCFTTSNADIAKIRQFVLLEYPDLPQARGVRSYGLHKLGGEWVALFENATIGGGEANPIFYASTPVDPGSRAHAAPPNGTDEQLEKAKTGLKMLPQLITSAAALAMLGYACASAYSPRITPHLGNRLPLLYVAGEREGGKTSAAQAVLELVTGYSVRINKAAGMTPYQYDVAHANANNLLALLDEYRPGEIDDAQLRKHHDLSVKWRGSGVAAKDHAYELNSPLIVLGEGFTEDAAALSRGVLYFIEKQHRGDLSRYSAFQKLPLWAYAGHLHGLARTLPDEQIAAWVGRASELAREAAGSKGGPRLQYALTYIGVGLLHLQADLGGPLFADEAIRQALVWGVHQTLDGGQESMTNLEVFLEQLGSVLAEHRAPASIVSATPNPGEIVVRPSAAVKAVRKAFRGEAGIANTSTLKKYAEGVGFVVKGDVHKDIHNSPVRGVKVDLAKVPTRCDVGQLEWLLDGLRGNRP